MSDLRQHLQELRELDDDSLLRSLKRHVGSSNRINALVLAHLAEVDARGAYRKWACQTLAAYCVYELRLSEDEAQRRCRAVRVMREFPVLFGMIADASIHLTGILLLAPYLTADNHAGVLVRARYRSKREIERLAAELAPSRDVPALVEPLGVAIGSRTVPRTGWAALTESTLGWVRHVEPGDGPARAPSSSEGGDGRLLADVEAEECVESDESAVSAASEVRTSAAPAHSEHSDAAERDGVASVLRPPLHYRVQFTADQAYVDLLERARALLWHQLPNGDLVELQRLALQALVDKLAKRKFGAKAAPTPAASGKSIRPPATMPADRTNTAATARTESSEANTGSATAPLEASESNTCTTAATVASESNTCTTAKAAASKSSTCTTAKAAASGASADAPARNAAGSRYIPAAVRREVWERDRGRCAFVDARGQRCRATSALEFHHVLPHARGGPATPANLGLRCRTHNQLAAEEDFGRDFMLNASQRPGALGASPRVPSDPGI